MSIDGNSTVFIDSNVFLAVIRKSESGIESRDLLNRDDLELGTSLLNLVEVRNVVMKKDNKTRKEASELISWLHENLDFIIEDFPSMTQVDQIHKTLLLDPMDTIFFCLSTNIEAQFVSIEKQLRECGAKHPGEII